MELQNLLTNEPPPTTTLFFIVILFFIDEPIPIWVFEPIITFPPVFVPGPKDEKLPIRLSWSTDELVLMIQYL